jgi:hypothetical protein
MKLDRFRAPALAAAAVLVISGAGIAFAAGPSAATPVPATPIVQAEPTGPETNLLQQGDQTTPDVAGAASTTAAESATSETAAEAPAGTGAAGTEAAGTEADGPGGHADPAGANVDHQFDGQE